MAKALVEAMDPAFLTVIVNVGDDDDVYGLRVCPDLDTVTYTLAGIAGPHGWGIAGDTFVAMEHLESLGLDTTFRLGDRDLATCLYRTTRLGAGVQLSTATDDIAQRLGVAARILPVTNDSARTKLKTHSGEWLTFQDYFVHRRHEDVITDVVVEGCEEATPAPGVIAAVAECDVLVIAPSNPVVSIWPLLAIPGMQAAVTRHPQVSAISPLFGGNALKGPAAALLRSTGHGEGNRAVAAAYDEIITHLIVDTQDASDVPELQQLGLAVDAMPTLLTDTRDAGAVATAMLDAAVASPLRTPA